MFVRKRKTEVGCWLNPPERGPACPPASVLDPPSSLPCPLPGPAALIPILQPPPHHSSRPSPAGTCRGSTLGARPSSCQLLVCLSVWVWEKEGSAHQAACWCWAERDWLSEQTRGEAGPSGKEGLLPPPGPIRDSFSPYPLLLSPFPQFLKLSGVRGGECQVWDWVGTPGKGRDQNGSSEGKERPWRKRDAS